ncbi:MAG: type II secretion system protein [Planctomycetota bacterium]|jgi:prepilin-type N-terminal cleavage/methylation domain-containing protein/prepilin-type processing-associated H-X9-DG protein
MNTAPSRRTRGRDPFRAGFTLVELLAVSRRKGKAFTLVELLVVVAILALLITILMPSLNRAKVLAQTTICQTKLHNIGRAAMLYAADNNDMVPRDFWYDCNSPNSSQWGHYLFAVKFLGYLGAPHFPLAFDDNDRRIYRALEDQAVFKCPCVKDPEFVLTYVVNGMDFEVYERTQTYTSGPASRLDELPAPPAEIFYIMEANISMVDPFEFGIYDVLYPGNFPFVDGVPSENPRAIRYDDTRHEGRTTLVFFDGHCEPRDLHPDDMPLTLFNPMHEPPPP